jgi:chromosome segregation ATPase
MEDQAQLARSSSEHEQSTADARARVEELERALADLHTSTAETIRTLESRVADLDRDLAAANAAQQDLERQHQARLGQLEAALAAARGAEQQVAERFATLRRRPIASRTKRVPSPTPWRPAPASVRRCSRSESSNR